MCKDCGCGLPGETPVGISGHSHDQDHPHDHDHDHEHAHDHGHSHTHGPGHHHGEHHAHAHAHPHTHSEHDADDHVHSHESAVEPHRLLEVRQSILSKNDRLAERNRGFFRARGMLVLNVLSSPGSGKTTFLRETVRLTNPHLKTGIIVGDLATDNDARKLRECGAPVVQIATGTVCHLEAEMVSRAAKQLDLTDLQLLVIENVGNLVCPASYDLGEDLRVVLLSVAEGEDKPLKYPPMFQAADVVVVSKMDLAQACGFDRAALMSNLRQISPKARVFETSAKTGQGMEPWVSFLLERHKADRDF